MKQRILGILAHPFPNKYVITVTRGDGIHMPVTRNYSCEYDNKKVWSYWKHFTNINMYLQVRFIQEGCLKNMHDCL